MKERKDNRDKEDSRRMGDMGRRRGSSKIGSGSQKINSRKVSQVDQSVWQEAIRKNVY